MIGELEPRRDPGDRRQRPGLDVAHDVVDRPDVPLPQIVVVEDVLDRGVRLPDVAGLVRVGGVVGPVDVALRELVADGLHVEARGVLRHVSLLVLDVDEDVVAVGVAAPALERPSVVQLLHLDVLGVVDRPAGLPGDHVQVVRVGGAGHRREEVVAEHELVGPLEVVRHVGAIELRIAEVGPVLADREPVHLPVVVHRVPRRRVVGKVPRQPLGTAAQPDLLAPAHAGAGAVGAGVPPEDVVEAAVLEHQVHDAIDGPTRGELLGRRARERRSRLGARR